jgi:hypothetical protein
MLAVAVADPAAPPVAVGLAAAAAVGALVAAGAVVAGGCVGGAEEVEVQPVATTTSKAAIKRRGKRMVTFEAP